MSELTVRAAVPPAPPSVRHQRPAAGHVSDHVTVLVVGRVGVGVDRVALRRVGDGVAVGVGQHRRVVIAVGDGVRVVDGDVDGGAAAARRHQRRGRQCGAVAEQHGQRDVAEHVQQVAQAALAGRGWRRVGAVGRPVHQPAAAPQPALKSCQQTVPASGRRRRRSAGGHPAPAAARPSPVGTGHRRRRGHRAGDGPQHLAGTVLVPGETGELGLRPPLCPLLRRCRQLLSHQSREQRLDVTVTVSCTAGHMKKRRHFFKYQRENGHRLRIHVYKGPTTCKLNATQCHDCIIYLM